VAAYRAFISALGPGEPALFEPQMWLKRPTMGRSSTRWPT